ncbi:monovalent cation/H+ antiporter complex subunit F [Brachybacterium sp.]|uniref:monovalent cation/H+ antiporter complex subunit F n=1 Tax=Brachybacterium sp. TaxID=1891286 RepID=UPI002ED587D7
MTPFEILLLVYAGVLALAALAVVYRTIVGPTILDRAIASDSLVTLVVMGMALYTAQSRASWAGPVMLALTGLAFIGTVTFARFVAREDPRQGRRRPHPEEPSTDTGPHEAIHFETAESADEVPGNHFAESPEADTWSLEDAVEDPHHPGEPEAEEPPTADGNAAADGTTTTDGADGATGADGLDPADPDHEDFGAGFGAGGGHRGFEDRGFDAGGHRSGGATEGGR